MSVGFSGIKIYALASDHDSPNSVYAGTSMGFYYSKDGGSTWQMDNRGLVNTLVQSIALDEIFSKKYLGTDGSGAYRWNSEVP